MSRGYYRMHRGWMENDLFAGIKLCEAAAWVWLIEHANFRDGKTLQRSQLSASVRHLAEQWKWSKSAVQRFLAVLKRKEQVTVTRQSAGRNLGRLPAVITVLNYDKYQPLPGQPWDDDRDAEWDARGTHAGHERDNSEVRGNERGSNLEEDSPPATPLGCDLVFDLWAELASEHGFHIPDLVTEPLRVSAKARLAEVGADGMRRVFAIIRESPFLLGRVKANQSDKRFRLKLAWLLGPQNFAKVAAGDYLDGPSQNTPAAGGLPGEDRIAMLKRRITQAEEEIEKRVLNCHIHEKFLPIMQQELAELQALQEPHSGSA